MDQRILSLAEYLFDLLEEKDSLPIDLIVSSIDTDVRVLKDIVSEYTSAGLSTSGLSIYLVDKLLVYKRENYFSIDKLRQLLFSHTHLFLLCKDLFNDTFTNLMDFSNDNFTSLSTMYRNTNILKDFLKGYQLELTLAKPPYFIGQESQIRNFYFELFLSAYGLSEAYYPANSEIYEELELVEKDLKMSLPLSQKVKLFSYISLTRITKGHFISTSMEIAETYDIQLLKSNLTDFYLPLLKKFGDSETNYTELKFYLFYIMTLDIIAADEANLQQTSLAKSSDLDVKRAKKWIKELTGYFDLSLSPASYSFLYQNVFNQNVRFHSLSHSSIKVSRDLLENRTFKDDEYYAWESTKKFVSYLDRKNGVAERQPKLVYFMLIRDVLFESKHKVKICVLSSISTSQKKYIEQKIRGMTMVLVEFCDTWRESPDLIISDYYCKKSQASQGKCLYVKGIPTENDYKVIHEEILQVYDQKKVENINRGAKEC